MKGDPDGSSESKRLGIVPIGDRIAAGPGSIDHLCGVVTQWKEPRRSNGGLKDYMISLTLTDPYTKCDIKMNMFHPSREALPAVGGLGDIMLCKNMTLTLFNNRAMACTKRGASSWVVFDSKTLVVRKSDGVDYDVTDADMEIAKLLQGSAPKQEAPLPSGHRAMLRTEEIKAPGTFFDYVGEVLVRNASGVGDRVALYLTDYTPNPHPIEYSGHDYGFVESHMLLQCTLWSENATAWSQIDWGSDDEVPRFVFIRNCRPKISQHGCLEFSVHGDRNPNPRHPKVQKLAIDDPRLSELLLRKKTYMAKRGLKTDTNHTPKTLVVHSIRTSVHSRSRFPYTLIEDVLSQGKLKELYRIRASIHGYRPSDVTKATKMWCKPCSKPFPADAQACWKCKEPIHDRVYQFLFIVKDMRGSRILAMYNTLEQRLFPDIPVVRLEDHPDIASKLESRLKTLSTEKISLDFAIQPYEAGQDQGTQFRILDTDFIFDSGPNE